MASCPFPPVPDSFGEPREHLVAGAKLYHHGNEFQDEVPHPVKRTESQEEIDFLLDNGDTGMKERKRLRLNREVPTRTSL